MADLPFKYMWVHIGFAYPPHETRVMRIEDKIQRALSITKNGVNMVNDESIRDTLMDLHNYAAMGVMLLDEKEESNLEQASHSV